MDEWYSIAGFNDPMSSISHLAGTAIFFVLSIFMLWSARRSKVAFFYCLQFAFTTLLLLSMSFVYHMMGREWVARQVMLRLDVAAIFLMIASTFTAVHGLLFRDWRRWVIITLLWSITIPAIVVRAVFFDQIPRFVGSMIFLVIGWIGGYSAFLVWKEWGLKAVVPMFLGGVLYSIGALTNAFEWPVLIDMVWGPHETFHLLVLGGLAMHWYYVWCLADGSFHRKFRPRIELASS